MAYNVPEGVASDGVLSGEGCTAQHDEDEDEVGEDMVVDELVAAHTDPVGNTGAWTQPQAALPLACWNRSSQAQLSLCRPGPTQKTSTTCPPAPRNYWPADSEGPSVPQISVGVPQTLLIVSISAGIITCLKEKKRRLKYMRELS